MAMADSIGAPPCSPRPNRRIAVPSPLVPRRARDGRRRGRPVRPGSESVLPRSELVLLRYRPMSSSGAEPVRSTRWPAIPVGPRVLPAIIIGASVLVTGRDDRDSGQTGNTIRDIVDFGFSADGIMSIASSVGAIVCIVPDGAMMVSIRDDGEYQDWYCRDDDHLSDATAIVPIECAVELIVSIKCITVGILHTMPKIRTTCGNRTFSGQRKALPPRCFTTGNISISDGTGSSNSGHSARQPDSGAFPARPSRSCRASRRCRSRCAPWKRSSGCCCSSAAGRGSP